MMHPRHVFVDLPKDRCPEVYRFRPPPGEAKGCRGAFHLLGKSKLSSARVEVAGRKLVTDLGRPRFDVVETVVTHGRGAPLISRSPRPCPYSKIGTEFQSRKALRAVARPGQAMWSVSDGGPAQS